MSRHPCRETEQSDGWRPESIGRRRFLRLAGLTLGAMIAGVRHDPAAAQQSKAAAGYRDSPNGGQRCADCRYFNGRSRTCQIVAGEISPNGWCRYFSPASRGGY